MTVSPPGLPPGDMSVGERHGHIEPRPVSWVVVLMVCGGFLAAGVGLVAQAPWLFFVGMGIVAAGTILGWVTHAMADVTARIDQPDVLVTVSDDEVAAR